MRLQFTDAATTPGCTRARRRAHKSRATYASGDDNGAEDDRAFGEHTAGLRTAGTLAYNAPALLGQRPPGLKQGPGTAMLLLICCLNFSAR